MSVSLKHLRQRIQSLASQTGTYYLACGRTGGRPVPAAGLYFDSRQTARAAAKATERYRERLRQYDPQLPYYDVIVCETSSPDLCSFIRDSIEPSDTVAHPPGNTSTQMTEREGVIDYE